MGLPSLPCSIDCLSFMKARVFPILLLAALLAGCATQPESRKAELKTPYRRPLTSVGAMFGSLPPAVQSTVLAEAGGGEITDAYRDTSSGRVIYKIFFRDPDLFPPLYVAPDGSVLNYDLTVAVAAHRGVLVKVSDLPSKVVKVIEDRGTITGISTISKEKWGDRTVYVVIFKDRAHYPNLYIADDGGLVEEGR
jgi:hypothetical protein